MWFKAAQEKWKTLEKKNKIRIVAIGAGVLVALILTMIFAFRTTWVDAFTRVTADDAGPMIAVLDDAGIRSNVDLNAGVLRVPDGQVDQARIAIRNSPLMFDPGFTFQDVVDSSGMGVTAGLQHQMFVQNWQTDVRAMLEATDIIQSATVQLNIPQVPQFMQGRVQSSASIRVTPAGGRQFSPEEGEAIAVAVARAVPGLGIEGVVVIDNNLNVLFRDGEQVPGGIGGMSNAETFQFNTREQIRASVLEVLNTVFGEVNVSAHANINFSTMEQVIRQFTSPLGEGTMDGLTDHEEILLRMALAPSDQAMGEPGLGSQGFDVPGHLFPGDFPAGDMTLFETEVTRQHLQDMSETFISAGAIPGVLMTDDSSVAVMATNHIEHREYIVRELGLLDDMSWLEFQATTGETEIFTHPNHDEFVAMIQAATGIYNVAIMYQNIHHFVDEMVPPLQTSLIILFSLIAIFLILIVFLIVRRTGTDVVEEIEPELSVEDLLVSSQLEEAKENEMARLAEIKYAGDSNTKEQIDKFADEMPESVAQLLRNWINEDWE